ncbi:hypothetical protein [Porphyrobacter sp. LM 6]|uniref:hypothetical protein n=1 Tax=Porphyrobacter sp. LM 6 TaxID=1896196 RepID=UPI000846993B|nr:hypothetical protein [Porphyrobacter sp. LM 6]AOL94751.1 hypothetical protein BG023_111832 [Porphyrobacter sp. LM 6]
MFIGHFAPAFVAAAVSPRSPRLGTLFVAAQLVDWGFFTLAMFGAERMRIAPGASVMVPFDLYHMPYTHSLIGAGIWALAFFAIVAILQRNLFAGVMAGLVVLSHWALDWLVHVPDLTIDGQPPKLGLGLWNYPWIAVPLELGLTIAAFAFYLRRTRGPVGPPMVLLAVMLLFQAINWLAPVPASAGPLLYLQALIAFALMTALAVWVGENRWFQKRGGLALSVE